MRILDFQPVDAGPVVARFNVELSADLKLLHWQLHRNANGDFRTFPPRVFGVVDRGRSTTLSPQLARQITAAATSVFFGGPTPNDHANAA